MNSSDQPVRESSLTELQVNRNNIKAQGYSIKTKRYRLTQWQYSGNLSYELYDHKFDAQELNNLANHADYIKIKDSLSIVLKQRVLEANKVPVNLGRQIDNVKPWFEPKRIIPRSKSK